MCIHMVRKREKEIINISWLEWLTVVEVARSHHYTCSLSLGMSLGSVSQIPLQLRRTIQLRSKKLGSDVSSPGLGG